MRLWPRSLFGRLALLLLLVIVLSQATAIILFRQDRVALLSRQFNDTKIVQIKALRAALALVAPRERRATLDRLGQEYGVRIAPDDGRRFGGGGPVNPAMIELQQRLRDELGAETELRVQPRLQLLWIKLATGDGAYWVGFPLPRPVDELPSRALVWSLVILLLLLVSAYAFARYLARPLRELNQAVASVGQGKSPPPLPEHGPSEIVTLNRGFNQMLASLRQTEDDRALLLAGVSHDLRTPLARLRLGIEMRTQDERTREGMVEDIEEMDRIITQFLDFARDDSEAPLAATDANECIAALVERYRRNGKDVRFDAQELPSLSLRPVAFSRLLSNLIDNALRYGSAVAEIFARREGRSVVIEVADRGPGVPPDQIERLKRPFTRGDPARTGATGAGLGLAIVERIARLHRGTFDLCPRDGGGTLARVTLPLAD